MVTPSNKLHEVYFRVRANHLQAHGALEEIRVERSKSTERLLSYELIELGHGGTAGVARSCDRQRLQRFNPALPCTPVPMAQKGDAVHFAFALAMPRDAKERAKKPDSDTLYLLQVLRRHGLEVEEKGCRRLRTRKIPLKSSSERRDFTGIVVDFCVTATVIDPDKYQRFLTHGNKTLRGFGIGLPILAGTALYAPFTSFDQ